MVTVTPEGNQNDSTAAKAEAPTLLLLLTDLTEIKRNTLHQVKPKSSIVEIEDKSVPLSHT